MTSKVTITSDFFITFVTQQYSPWLGISKSPLKCRYLMITQGEDRVPTQKLRLPTPLGNKSPVVSPGALDNADIRREVPGQSQGTCIGHCALAACNG